MGDHLEVTVAPIQGCFFAGERFTAHITFTNTSKPVDQHSGSGGSSPLGLHARGHKSALSLSLSTPSSPVTAPATSLSRQVHLNEQDSLRPRTPLSATFAALPKQIQDEAQLPLRKGLVGRNSQIIAANANRGKMAAAGDQQVYPSRRAPSTAHSHKKFSYSMALSASSTDLTDLSAQHAADMYGLGRNESMDSVVAEGISDYARTQHQPSAPLTAPHSRRTMSMSHLPGNSSNSKMSSDLGSFASPRPVNIDILWSFAQLQGSFEVDDTLIKPTEFNAVKRSLFAESGLVGGGSLDAPPQDMGWRDWLWWSSSTSQAENSLPEASHQPSVSGGVQAGWTLADRRSRALADRTVPILLIPPTVFATDLVLSPGESKTFAYSIILPGDLPPSHRGRSVNFRYNLSVGINCSSSPIQSSRHQRCRLIHVPIRLYNNVADSGARPFYDMTNPIVWLKDEAEAYQASTAGLNGLLDRAPASNRNPVAPAAAASAASTKAGKEDVYEYVSTLRNRSGIGSNSGEESGEMLTSLAAIEMISRTSTKASFDINKDGYRVASVTFAKSAFRLGETLYGAIALNLGDARCLRMSARLETHEQIETTISMKKAGQVRTATRKLHNEQHEVAVGSGRLPLSLSIPSGATPDFATSGVRLQWSVRFSFLVVPPAAKPPQTKSGHGYKPSHSKRSSIINAFVASDLTTEPFAGERTEVIECAIPIKVYPGSTPFRPTPFVSRF